MSTSMIEPESTETLFRRAQAGDSLAFDEIALRSRRRLRAVVLRRGCPAPDADDVVQETFVKVLELIPRAEWRGEDSFHAWLATIAANIARRHRDRGRRRAASPLDVEPASSDPSASRRIAREERLGRLEDALDSLSPDHRRVIRLARIRKMPIQEIAREMDRTPGAISQLLLRALDQLKQRFGDTQSLRLPPCALDETEDGGRDDSAR